MNSEIRVALIVSDDAIIRDLKTVISEKLARLKGDRYSFRVYSAIPTVEEIVGGYGASLIFVHMEPGEYEDQVDLIAQLGRVADRIPVIVTATEFDTDIMLTCIKKGVKDFLRVPCGGEEVEEMLGRLLEGVPAVSRDVTLAETHTFFSYKGGIGNTFLACNTAVALAQMTDKRVLIWDLVLQNGDVPFFFDVEPQSTLTDLMENISEIDESYLHGVLPPHSSGVSILAGPKRPEEAEGIRYDQIQNVRQILSRFYDYIVIDGGHALTDQVIGAMDVSKHILLTTDLHLPVLKNTLRCIEIFERLGYMENKFKVILNRYNSKYETFDLARAKEILRYPISFTFTNDYVTVSRSLNTGIPIAELEEKCQLAREFEVLARLLISDFKADVEKPYSLQEKIKGLFAKGKKKKKEEVEAALAKAEKRVKKNAAE